MTSHDLVIRGGTIYDGTGGTPFQADIAVSDGKITDIGKISGAGQDEVDANGAMVTPGFVDIHTHYDGLATWENRMNPSSHHGVTTVVMGNCGVGFAPVRTQDHDLLIKLMEGVEDIPGIALHEGLPWSWESFPDYLDFLQGRQYDMDIAAQLPHAALRVYVMGERGANREDATQQDIAEMRRLTAEAIRAGALGFSSSRTLNHRSSTGDPTPSLTAAREELIGIGLGLKDAGTGVLEIISDFKGLDQEFELIMDMVDAANAPMTISLAQGINAGGWRKLMNKINDANAAGRKVKGQVAPRAIGVLLGLTTTLNPFVTNSAYKEIARQPLEERIRIMRDPAFKQRVLEANSGENQTAFIFNRYETMWALNDGWDYEPLPADSVKAEADRRGVTAESLVYDLLLEQEGQQLLYTPFANYAENNLDCCREMILEPNTVMGLGDGGAHVGTICDASFITYLFTHWGRDRRRGEGIDLATLVKAQTRDTAATVGLLDRGLLAEGMKADINVIDFDKLSTELPQMVQDLPAGGSRLEQRTRGYLATVVSGNVTYRNGEATDALPGRLVRGAKTG